MFWGHNLYLYLESHIQPLYISQNVLRIQPLSIPGISHTTIIYFSECLEELGLLIKTFGMNVCQPSPGKALSMMASQICDRDNGVRSSALNAIVEAYILVGETVYTHCGRVRARLFIVVVVSVLLLFLFLSWVGFWLLLRVWLLVSVALALILFERVGWWYGRLTVWAVKVWLFKNVGDKDLYSAILTPRQQIHKKPFFAQSTLEVVCVWKLDKGISKHRV